MLRGSGFYIDPRKKSGWHGRFDGVFVTGHCALMGRGDAFRGVFFDSFGTRRGKRNAHILNKGSQTALIICLSVSLCLNARTRDEAAEKTDAGRVAPISGSVFYQIDRLKSGFEVMGRTVMPGNCALMGATRLASGHFSAASGRVAPIRGCVSYQIDRLTSKYAILYLLC